MSTSLSAHPEEVVDSNEVTPQSPLLSTEQISYPLDTRVRFMCAVTPLVSKAYSKDVFSPLYLVFY